MPPVNLDYESRREFDTGLFVARYLQVLAWLSIASMIAGPIFFDRFRIDVSFLFLFWAAAALKRHSATARKWVLGLSGLTLAFALVMAVWAVVGGTSGMRVSLGRRPIDHPAVWQVLVAMLPFLVIVGVPFVVLCSGRARRQFSEKVVRRP